MWLKLETGLRSNGKIAEAGPDGALVFLTLLALHAERGSHGLVPASCCRPARLRVEGVALIGHLEPQGIEAALERCVRAELIARHAAGAIEIRGWSAQFQPRCARCKHPNPEPSHATCPMCRDLRTRERKRRGRKGAQPAVAPGCAGVDNVATDRTGQDSTPNPLAPMPEPAADPPGAGREGGRPARWVRPGTEAHPVADLTRLLLDHRYRACIGNQITRRAEARRAAEQLLREGLDATRFNDLVRAAEKATKDDYGALLASWIDSSSWREVLAELDSKRQEVAP